MFLYFSKLLPLLVYPVSLACILILMGLVVRGRGWQKATLSLAFGVLFITGNHWVSLGVAQILEWRYLPPQPGVQAEAIIILAGDMRERDTPRVIPEVGEAGDRIIYAAHLYNQGAAPVIIHSGGNIEWLAAIQESQEGPAYILEALGVPANVLKFETNSRNTYESAVACAELLQELGLKSVLLVTSAAHMPRSVGVFERQGIEVIPAPVDYTVTRADWQQFKKASLGTHLIYLIPSSNNLEITTRMLKEYLGLLVYKLRGWL